MISLNNCELYNSPWFMKRSVFYRFLRYWYTTTLNELKYKWRNYFKKVSFLSHNLKGYLRLQQMTIESWNLDLNWTAFLHFVCWMNHACVCRCNHLYRCFHSCLMAFGFSFLWKVALWFDRRGIWRMTFGLNSRQSKRTTMRAWKGHRKGQSHLSQALIMQVTGEISNYFFTIFYLY